MPVIYHDKKELNVNRMMEKHSATTFRDFAQYVYRQFGMRIATFVAYRDREGDPTITLFVKSLYLYLQI